MTSKVKKEGDEKEREIKRKEGRMGRGIDVRKRDERSQTRRMGGGEKERKKERTKERKY